MVAFIRTQRAYDHRLREMVHRSGHDPNAHLNQLVLLKLSGFSLELLRLPNGKSKQRLLQEVQRACTILPLRKVLGMIRLSPSRYHAWVRPTRWRRRPKLATLLCFGSCRRNICSVETSRSQPVRTGLAIPTPLAIVLAVCQGPLRLLPCRIDFLRGSIRFPHCRQLVIVLLKWLFDILISSGIVSRTGKWSNVDGTPITQRL